MPEPLITHELVERCARAAYETWANRLGLTVGGKLWPDLSETSKEDYRAEAAAVLRTALTPGAAR